MKMETFDIRSCLRKTGRLHGVSGRVCATVDAGLGELVTIYSGSQATLAEVIGFERDEVQLMPIHAKGGFRRGDIVEASGCRMRVPMGPAMLGRVINAFGEPIDGKGPLRNTQLVELRLDPPPPLSRSPITRPFATGVTAIDGLLTMGYGQRVGLFAGSGVGKSTLLGEIAKYAASDINVVALVGERGREVRPFIEENLGPRGLARSVVVVSTSDEPPLARIRASELAVCVASFFRSAGEHVLLMLDSLTRLSQAQRELGLLLGEPPTSRGYTPSVFQKMSQLLEQLGNGEAGSITGLLTVLVDGDDMNEPITDAARSILDGHVVLDRKLANQGHFPAINVLESISRLFTEIVSKEHLSAAERLRSLMSRYQEVEDLIQIGAYKKGTVPAVDQAIDLMPTVNQFLKQGLDAPIPLEETLKKLALVARNIRS